MSIGRFRKTRVALNLVTSAKLARQFGNTKSLFVGRKQTLLRMISNKTFSLLFAKKIFKIRHSHREQKKKSVLTFNTLITFFHFRSGSGIYIH